MKNDSRPHCILTFPDVYDTVLCSIMNHTSPVHDEGDLVGTL
jgi:hypothetical protein